MKGKFNSLAKGKGETRLLGGLGKVQAFDREITDSKVILGDNAFHGS